MAALGYFLYPYLQVAYRYMQLMSEEMPESLPVPVRGVSQRSLVDTWGGARSEGRRHEGIDIFAPRNTEILSTTRGVVERIGENRLGGRTVTILGPGGHHHYYAHLERYPDLEVGDWVEPGDVVGYVGDSGNARGTPPHLHYGIYRPGWEAINPYPLLTGRAPSVSEER
nr:M23 family metallopeptidase [Deinobacterium chartae]